MTRNRAAAGGALACVDSSRSEIMIKLHNIAALLAISSVAALPACSMFGGDNNASRTSRSTPQSPALSQDMVQQVQTRLQQQGMYRGSIDGQWGPATEAAVRSYQQQHDINATGQLDTATLASLNLGSKQISANTPPTIQRSGSYYNPPINADPTPNTNTPADNSTQPNASTRP
jgi:peptidoglycan hydrolase-like protein with peptidoglycan-binding domain